jgi:hypothetical protein
MKKLYVTVPPAELVKPNSVAKSVTEPPTVIVEEERVVDMVTRAGAVTVKGSHALVAGVLFVSPL